MLEATTSHSSNSSLDAIGVSFCSSYRAACFNLSFISFTFAFSSVRCLHVRIPLPFSQLTSYALETQAYFPQAKSLRRTRGLPSIIPIVIVEQCGFRHQYSTLNIHPV